MPNENKIPKSCPKCGKRVIYFSGVNREGREYHFYGCEDRTDCRWIYSEPSKSELRHEEIMNALRHIYAKLGRIEEKVESIALREYNRLKEISEKKDKITRKMAFTEAEDSKDDEEPIFGKKSLS